MSDQAQGSEELLELADLAAECARELAGDIDTMTSIVLETLASGGALLFCGNGGSAADAQTPGSGVCRSLPTRERPAQGDGAHHRHFDTHRRRDPMIPVLVHQVADPGEMQTCR